MPTWVSACKVADLPPGEAVCVNTDAEPIAVFNIDGAFFACSDCCPHAGGPLSQGYLDGTCVSCPWHGWAFELNDPNPPKDGVTRYKCRVEGEDLQVELP